MTKKRVLCYGDSNTWGYIPLTGKRFDENARYTKLLQKLLGEKYEVVEDGLRGRNVGHDFNVYPRGNLNGAITFPQSLIAHDPLDYVIIMLGTNDLDARFNSNAQECAKILEKEYITLVKEDLSVILTKTPTIVIVAPNEMTGMAEYLKDKGVIEKSHYFNIEYKKIAEENNCLFVDNTGLVAGEDGIHLTKESHMLLAKKLYDCLTKSN